MERKAKEKAKEIEQSMGGTIKEPVEPQVVTIPLPKGAEVEAPAIDSEYKIEVIKDWHGNIDPFYLAKKDPRYEYRFLRADDKNLSQATSNMLFQGGGWQLCDKVHCLRIGIQERFIDANGQYRVGDLLLAFIPKHLFEEKRKKDYENANAPIKAIEKRMKEGFDLDGEIHESMKGIQTEKRLGAEGLDYTR